MLDLAFIRNHPDIVKEVARVKYNPIDIDYLLEVDRQVLELQRRVEEARKGFTPLTVPSMATEFGFIGSGQFPRGRDQVYAIEDGDTFLVGTAEVSITGMYHDEIFTYEDLPLTVVGYCPCFRKEAHLARRCIISNPFR